VWLGFVFGCVDKFNPVAAQAMNSMPRKLSVSTPLARADELIK
jgi:hypothetical protein